MKRAVLGVVAIAFAVAVCAPPCLAAVPEALRGVELTPRSLASADFDGDGVADIVAGFGTPEGGVVVFYRGNPDALYPNAPGARERLAQDPRLTSPFLTTEHVLALPAPPDLLVAGDFDADGRIDLAAAASGSDSVEILSGDGEGGFRSGTRLPLDGTLTALASGDVGLRDGIADLAAAVDGPAGARVLLFQSSRGARHAAPVAFALPEPADTLSTGSGELGRAIDVRLASGRFLRIERVSRAWRPLELPDAAETTRAAAPAEEEGVALPVRIDRHARGRVVLLSDGVAPVISSPAATFIVDVTTNLDDAAPGNGVCADINGDCSLRAAIEEANALPGDDTITFAIPGSGVPSIPVASLPNVTEAVTIDGTTQSAGRVAVTGTSNGFLVTLAADGCTVRGLVLNGNGTTGLRVQSSGNVIEGNLVGTTPDGTGTQGILAVVGINLLTGSNNQIGGTVPAARNVIAGGSTAIRVDAGTGHVIQGNYIGTDVTGTVDLGGTSDGVRVFGASATATIGGSGAGAGNVISGYDQAGVELDQPGSVVQGNRIGTNAAGNAAIPNGTGIDGNFAGDMTLGGASPGAGNLVSGNAGTGVDLQHNAVADIVIQGNWIGLDAGGSFAIPNQGHGLRIVGASEAQIGGSTPGARNVISGNLFDGIFFTKFVTVAPTANAVQGNFIGTDATGTVAVANLQNGIAFEFGENNLIGGTGAGEGNVISGNFLHGIDLGLTTNSVKNQIFGNRIGTNAFGNGPLGNRLSGIFIPLNTHGALIGGTGAGQANTIAYNGGAGVASDGGRALHVAPNAIYDNGGLGLDLFDDGVTPNRPGVSNNFPVITTANDIGGGTSVAGYLDATPATNFNVHVFSSLGCDPSGYGEGREYRATLLFTTDAAGHGVFSTTITPPIPAGRYVTAYAVAPGNADDTSEFSFCRQLSGGPPPDDVPLALFAITPGSGGKGTVTVQVAGQGLVPGATVRLERAGSPDIPGSDVSVSDDGTTLTATFSLAAAAVGAWDVTVDIPGDTATLAQAFTVAAATAPEIWADLIGRGLLVVRAGREQTFFLTFGNRGNTDAPPTVFRVALPWQLRVVDAEPAGPSPRVVTLDSPMTTGGSGQSDLYVYVPSVPASTSGTVAFRLRTIAAQEGEFGEFLDSAVTWDSGAGYAPLFENAGDPGVSSSVNTILDTPAHYEATVHFAKGATNGDLHLDVTVQDSAFESAPVLTSTSVGGQTTYRFTVGFRNTPAESAKVYSVLLEGPDPIFDLARSGESAVESRRKERQDDLAVDNFIDDGLLDQETADRLHADSRFATALTAALDAIRSAGAAAVRASHLVDETAIDFGPLEQIGHGAWTELLYAEYLKNPVEWNSQLFRDDTVPDTGVVHSKDEIVRTVLDHLRPGNPDTGFVRHQFHVFAAIDPNEKAGPSGTGDPSYYIDGASPSAYAITFENVETANAPAQEVLVTDQLDASKLDLATFELGPIAFGTHVVAVPPGRTSFTGDVDLRPGIDVVARVTAGLDAATGLATWHFFSLDPATGLPTENPVLGFLPPNVNTPEGEGHVSFTIRAKPGLASGTQIHNMATIVFDANPAIDTADWFNTLDVTAPSSQVAALPASACSGILVQWSGTDAHSGIASYDLFVSENGGAFEPWLSETTSTSGVFFGNSGSSYAFYSVAHDAAGNVEAPPGSADAATTVGFATPLTDSLAPTSGPATGASVTLTGGGYVAGALVFVGLAPASGVVVNGPTSLTATFPALAPGALYDVAVQNPGGCASTFAKAWLADFLDVLPDDIFHASVEKIARHGVTVGCGNGLYCIDRPVTRAEMAVFLIKGKYNLSLVPPPATGTLFGDVHPGDFAADFIEQLAGEGITVGCGNGNYCPDASITRAEMAVFLLKSEHGPLYVPPPATGTVFDDVHPGDFAADWIEQLYAEGITGGCDADSYCPGNPVTRGQMAAFLSLTFGF